MRHELWYTSARRGLAPGSSGFCTVKVTCGIPPPLREVLERMSSYNHVYPPGHKRAGENPVIISCVSATVGGKKWRILSRICDAGLDHTNRTNFFAHHIAYDAAEGPRDPAWLASQPDTFAQQWDLRSEELGQCRELPSGTENVRPCAAWRAVSGDAGWAGAVADAIFEHNAIYLISDGTRFPMPLISEVASLLPISKRSEFTFSTLYQGSPSGSNCQLRCVVAGSDEAKRAIHNGARAFDLAGAPLGTPPETQRVTVARTGIWPEGQSNVSETNEPALPETFVVTNRAPSAASPRARPDAETVINRSSTVPYEKPYASEADASRAWLPMLSGFGGIALCALALSPLILWYRAENFKQQSSITQLNSDIDASNIKLRDEQREKSTLEKERDALRKDKLESEHQATMARTSTDQQIREAKSQNEQFKRQHDEDAKTIQNLQQQLKEAKSAPQKPAEPPADKKDSVPTKSDAKSEAPEPEPTFSRLPKPPTTLVGVIDVIPGKPASIEIVDVPEFHVISGKDQSGKDQWEIQQQDKSPIAVLSVEEDRQHFRLRINWNRKRSDLAEAYNKLSVASLKLSDASGTTLFVPLYYPLSPPKTRSQSKTN